MNTVLVQESSRYNNLINCINDDLDKFIDANRGRIVMNEYLERMGHKLLENEVPHNWTEEDGIGFLSIKSLSSWILELIKRVQFLHSWSQHGIPKSFWMSGFFFPQAFITGIKQNFARKFNLPIDRVTFEHKILRNK
mmetsp:Transcript_67940/g.146523  ORF Transcript_67940/g.146523 Transcript_67940/m.146523 type:complete len:137 (+) Transcript_67940:894-1304(+)